MQVFLGFIQTSKMARPRNGCFTVCKILFLVMSLFSFSSESFYPHTVKNHVVINEDLLIDRFFVQDWISCIMACQNDPKCLSYNYQYEKKENGLCELYECGVKQDKDLTERLAYSYGFLFQQLKHNKRMKLCGDCHNGWMSYELSPHCYKVIDDKRNWEKASEYCRSIGANLTSVHSEDENTFITDAVRSRIGSSSKPYFWIGARWSGDAASEFTFQDNSKTSYRNFASDCQAGSPTNADCQCVNVDWSKQPYIKEGRWCYYNCKSSKPFVCKY